MLRYFQTRSKRLKKKLSSIIFKGKTPNTNEEERELKQADIDRTLLAYDQFYFETKADLSHYFRTIYHIYKFIDNSKISNKKQYASIARAQLSSYEQILLFYNCLHENGSEKFKPLIEKYSVFKNIDKSLIINQDHLIKYDKSAFGE